MSFTAAVSYPAGTNPQEIVTADFNNDGRLDLATTNAGGNSVSVLLGNGDGTFQSPETSAAGDGPVSIAVGDFNGDGKLDLTAANSGAGAVSVMRGNGDGTFQAPASIALGGDPTSVAVGDFNDDGTLDVAATSNVYLPYYNYYYGNYGFYEGHVHVLLGNGAGSFAAPTDTPLGSGYHASATSADFDGDGDDDFAAVSFDYGAVSVALGNTDFPLAAVNSFGTGWLARDVTAGDFTGDGKLDLATAGQTVGILAGFGDGTFQGAAQQQFVDTAAIASADFNADGKLDVATADPWSQVVGVMLGRGDATLTLPINHAAGSAPAAVAAGDFNGDGRPDVAAANSGSGNVSVLLNDGAWLALNAPTVSVGDVALTEGNTGALNAVFTVTLSAASSQNIVVRYATADGTAAAGADYQARSGQVTILAGQTSTTIAVPVTGDRSAENSETFSLRLTEATNAFMADGVGVATILDDEPRISINSVSLSEGNGKSTSFTFTVRLSAAYDQAVTVNYGTASGTATAGSDYQTKSGTVAFAAGETVKTITVVVNGDKAKEANETFFLDLLGSSSNALIAVSRGTGTIFNDDRR